MRTLSTLPASCGRVALYSCVSSHWTYPAAVATRIALSPLSRISRSFVSTDSSHPPSSTVPGPMAVAAPRPPAGAGPSPPPSSSAADADATGAAAAPSGPTFASLGVPSFLLGRLGVSRIHRPTPIQSSALARLCADLTRPPPDTVLHAETGSGKTLAYLLPILARLPPKEVPHARLRAVIVTPTRELSLQVAEVAESLSGAAGGHKKRKLQEDPDAKTIRVRRVVGEASAQLLHELKVSPPHILVGTPTTLAALVPAHVNTGELVALVLDEADELLRNHSVAAVRSLVKTVMSHGPLPGGGRPAVLAVSATSSFGLQKFAAETLRGWSARERGEQSPVIDLTQGGMTTPTTLTHHVLRYTDARAAFNTFSRFLAAVRPTAVLSFHNSAASLEALEAHLRSKGVPVAVLGNAYSNSARAAALEGVRSGRVRVLLSTEMAARGMDLPRISHVVNFDPPASVREYVHRAGRAGRLSSLTPGRSGVVVNMAVDDKEAEGSMDIARRLGVPLFELILERGEARTEVLYGGAADRAAHAAALQRAETGKLRVPRGGAGNPSPSTASASASASTAAERMLAEAVKAATAATRAGAAEEKSNAVAGGAAA